MHAEAFRFVRSVAHAIAVAGKRVLEVGSYDVKGSVRPLFESAAYYHGIDLRNGPGVDEVVDARAHTPSKKYDIIVSTEVLEHCAEWAAMLQAMRALCKKGGVLILTCATDPRAPHGVDGDGVKDEYYENVHPDDLLPVLESIGWGNVCLEQHTDRGDLYATAVAI